MKNSKILHTITLVLCFGLLFSQKDKKIIETAAASVPTNKSGTEITENSAFPIKLTNAQYDAVKKNLPYFTRSYQTGINQNAKPVLNNVSFIQLSSDVSQKIKTSYNKYLSSNFQLDLQELNENSKKITFVKITPYRINNLGLIEELTSFEVKWEITDSENFNQKTVSVNSFTNNSVLSTGNWYKIGLTKSGIYKLDKNYLQSIGIDVSNINPKNIRIYGNGGHMLPQFNSKYRNDDLKENAIEVIGENDNSFDNNDYVLFYGEATNEWIYDTAHKFSCLNFFNKLHYYSDTTYYFLTADLGAGKRITQKPSVSAAPTNITSTYDYYDYHEVNSTNFIKSGSEFFGEYFDLNTAYTFNYPVPNLVQGDTISAYIKLAARGLSTSLYNFSYSGSTITFTGAAVNLNDYLGDFVSINAVCNRTLLNSNSIVTFNVTKQTANAVAWLDKIIFNCRRNLTFNNTQFLFRDSRTIGAGNVTQMSLNTNGYLNIRVWDVTDVINPAETQYNLSGNTLDFKFNNDSLREYVVFNGSDYLTPSFVTKVANQNLHGINQADYVIVTYPGYYNQAQKLAQIHQQYDTLTTAVVTSDQVYNEFSSGKPDVTAIRDFVRMLYKRNLSAGKEVKYLLLFGDGSYKTKDRYSSGNTAMLPVYQVGGYPLDNSWNPTLSTVCDDFFGWLDDTEGEDWQNGLVDIGIGRFPVKTTSEAFAAVDKVEAYYKKNYNFNINSEESTCSTTNSTYPLGDWRNWVTFIADDEDAQQHLSDADNLAVKLRNNHPEYNIDKIYSDAYIQYSTPGGQRYYDVNNAIDQRVNKGTLVMNYTGHGGEVGLGHERFLEISQIQSYNNKNNMPLFITATCEFSRFDDPDRTSAGELCFLNPNGAAIALLTTVRLAFSNTNFTLNSNLYDFIFDTLPNGKTPALGDIVKLTKRKSLVGFYYLNFHLLGDPALKLAYPNHKVFTTHINNKPVTTTSFDTLSALSKVTIKGFVGDKKGNKLTNFNGVLNPTVFDKEQQITCLGNDPASITSAGNFKFITQKNIIYKGKVEVSKGDFVFTFIVPKDIAYNLDLGKISYYAQNGLVDANGYNKNIYIGGSAGNVIPDNAGPSIGLYMNDKKFVSGGTTNETPKIYAEVSDSSGINTVGTGIGHDITAILDENSSKPIVLNDYYEADLNSYQSGKIRYPFSELSEGNHRLSLKVWDVQNNSSVAYTDFVVAKSADIALTHVLNYPNPFTTRTQFFFENNQCCQKLNLNIQIYTISGKVVKTISQSVTNEGFRSSGIDWDGKDDYGDKLAKGVYVYKLSITGTDGKKAEKTEKLVILN